MIGTRNGITTLEDQLRALERQDFDGSWELIVADQSSTDGTTTLAARWQDRLPLSVLDVPESPGVGHTRNRGAAAARGELLLFCDQDDVVAPNWISALVAAARDAAAVGGRCEVVELNSPDARYWRGIRTRYPESEGWLIPSVPACNLAVRREVFDELGGFDEGFVAGGEDTDLCWRLHRAGHRLALSDDAVVHYRLRSTVRGVAAQAYRYGRSEPVLYRRHRSAGMRARSPVLVLKSWGWLAVHCWRLGSRRERGRWMWIAGKNVGRIVGSFRAHVVYF